jgi:hypothetical protein
MTVPAGSRAYLDELFVSSVPKGDFSSVPEGGREIPYILLAFGVCFGAMLFKRRAHAGV